MSRRVPLCRNTPIWVALIGQSRGIAGMTSDEFRRTVAGHWERGAKLL